MKRVFESLGVTACGLITFVLTAVIVATISRVTGFNVFAFSVWVVVPIGAIGTGIAAASGYYFGSLFFHKRPNVLLLLQMVLMAGLSYCLIYYIEYSSLVLKNGARASDYITLGQYMDIVLTKAHYRVGRAAHDVGEVGQFGYWLAALEFLGFLLGGLCTYIFLQMKPVCSSCNFYLRPLASKAKTWGSPEMATSYYETVFAHRIDGPEFAAMIGSKVSEKVQKGAVCINTTLHGCPNCKEQLIEDKVKVYNGSDWKDVSRLDRRVRMPQGLNLVPVFRQ